MNTWVDMDMSIFLWLSEWLANYFHFSCFQYLTLRAILGTLTALVMSFGSSPYVIRRLVFRSWVSGPCGDARVI